MRVSLIAELAILFVFTTIAQAELLHAQELQLRLDDIQDFVESHCIDCHVGAEPEGSFDLEPLSFSADQFSAQRLDTAAWEKILRRVDAREMPPASADRPPEDEYQKFSGSLSQILHKRSQTHPRSGRIGSVRRLTRTEYQNSVRDLLGIQINAADYLPKDESSHGFDNITVEELSPMSLNRYVSAAQKIARAAVGGVGNGPSGVTIRIPADRSQEDHVPGLPFGTRGGTLIEHHFPRSGQYEIELKLTRDRDEKVEGLHRKHDIDVLLDRKRMHRFQVVPPKNEGNWENRDFTHSDSHLKTRIEVQAGKHSLGITFPKTFSSLVEEKRQPFDANFNRHRHPRRTPAIYQVSIVGPFDDGEAGQTESRRLIFGDISRGNESTRDDAKKILKRLARRAFRRPVTEDDLETPMRFFDEGFSDGGSDLGFEKGIESAVSSLLVNPNFLFRIEANRDWDQPTQQISDIELASRLSYFLWSSIPDEELLGLATDNRLSEPDVLRDQVKRMLADGKSKSLVENFASQWLYLRNLESITPNVRLFPDFDDNLRQSFRLETEQLFADIVRIDRSVLKLIRSEHTYLNDRLATHYGIPNVRGSEFRKVQLPADSRRGGILRHGSILMVTSYATRTSPTIRGNWILENILGTPAPPPPPNIPNLKENTTLEVSTLRERLAAHRADPACASCHDRMDPIGFSLENYDAVGRWRTFEGTLDVDAAGMFPTGKPISSAAELEDVILERPQMFVRTLTEKLITYGLGRAVEPFDGPAVRSIESAAAKDDYRFSSIVTGIVLSDPFRLRLNERFENPETGQ
ncbi:DUF1592 domain-containing protein [Mariniblastus fucicola]|nr:DUF1592 domain-containing protein [Mariniblastus fucicola]